jgi:putative SOS response-associated peptidase YedK
VDAFGCQVKAAVYNRAQGQRAIRLRWIVRELAAKRRESLKTFTILIISENEFMRPIHNRMPVILEPKDYERWLDAGDPARPPVDLLRPYPAERMVAWPVSDRVGNVRNNDPALLEPSA